MEQQNNALIQRGKELVTALSDYGLPMLERAWRNTGDSAPVNDRASKQIRALHRATVAFSEALNNAYEPVGKINTGENSDANDLIAFLEKSAASSGPSVAEKLRQAAAMVARVKHLEMRDSEAATHVESVIAMRPGFTGDAPYIGWKGLGLALTEALDEHDKLRTENANATHTLRLLYSGYVRTLEVARDRIIFLGGDCDTIKEMEALDPVLREARATIEGLGRKAGA